MNETSKMKSLSTRIWSKSEKQRPNINQDKNWGVLKNYSQRRKIRDETIELYVYKPLQKSTSIILPILYDLKF